MSSQPAKPLPERVTLGGHDCVLDPETRAPWRNYRCVNCHARDGFHVTTCELWTELNNRFNGVGSGHTA